MSEEDDYAEDYMAWLEEGGALTWEGMSDDGDRILSINHDKLQEMSPELYASMNQEMEQQLNFLYSMGYIEVGLDENGEIGYAITEEGKKMLNKHGFGVIDD